VGEGLLCRHCGKPLRIANDYAGPTWAHERNNGTVFDCGNPTSPAPPVDFEPTTDRQIAASLRHGWTPAARSSPLEDPE
jgi:hypothetical protein